MRPDDPDDVVVEAADPVGVLRRIHRADLRIDPDLFQIVDIGQDRALEGGALQQNLEFELLAGFRVDELAAPQFVAGLLEQVQSLAQVGAHLLRIPADRVFVRCGEHLFRHAVLELLQDFLFSTFREAGGSEFGAPEIAVDTVEPVIGKVVVEAFEVEGVVQCPADPLVLELLAPHVGRHGLHDARGAQRVFDLLADDLAALDRREVIGRRPSARRVFLAEICGACAKGLEFHIRIDEIDIADFAEIVLADIYIEILGPVVVTQFVADRLAGIGVGDLVGPRAHDRLECGLGDVARFTLVVLAFPPVLGHDGQLTEDLRQFLVVLLVEGKGDFAVAGLLGRGHMGVVARLQRIVRLVALEGEDHVFRRDRLAIGKSCLFADQEGCLRNVVGKGNALGDQPVGGADFLLACLHQRIEDEAQPDSRVALGENRVERVEGAFLRHAQRSALWRIRIDVVEPLEALFIFGLSHQRGRVVPFSLGGWRLGVGGAEVKREAESCEAYGKTRSECHELLRLDFGKLNAYCG